MSEAEDDAESPTMPPGDDSDVTLYVTSLRPTRFSQGRLLNAATIAVAGVLLLALAIHWLPSVLPQQTKQPNAQATRTAQAFNAQLPPVRGAGWKPIGPDSAQDITFTANGALGYICGINPRNAGVSWTFYDVHQNLWDELLTPASGVGCRVSVSSADINDVVLIAFDCLNCQAAALISQVYRSHDGGAHWASVSLPAKQFVADITWVGSTLFLAALDTASENNATQPHYHLLVSRSDGPLTEISGRQLTMHPADFSSMTLQSSGTTLYAEISEIGCARYCDTLVQSSDEGRTWRQSAPSYRGAPLVPVAAQLGANTLVGWSRPPDATTMIALRSLDNGTNWSELPLLPENAASGGAELVITPDAGIIAYCYGQASMIYLLPNGATRWQAVAPLPAGAPLTVQYDERGHAVALWGRSHLENESGFTPGLEYYPLNGSHAGG